MIILIKNNFPTSERVVFFFDAAAVIDSGGGVSHKQCRKVLTTLPEIGAEGRPKIIQSLDRPSPLWPIREVQFRIPSQAPYTSMRAST